MDTFVIDTVQSVLDTDANPSIRPMTYYVESPERISGLFDRIAYDKCEFYCGLSCKILEFSRNLNERLKIRNFNSNRIDN